MINSRNLFQFDLIDYSDIEYNQELSPGVLIDSLNRDNIGMCAKFMPKQGAKDSPFCVATTHLLFNPKRIDVRLAQMVLLLAELNEFCKKGHNKPIPVILTGDLNTANNSHIYQLLTEGACPNKHLGRGNCANFLIPPQLGITNSCQYLGGENRLDHSEKKKKAVKVANISDEELQKHFNQGQFCQDFGFKSVYNPHSSDGKNVTTRQNRYVMVDYIFYSRRFSKYLNKFIESNLKLLAKVDLLTEADCTQLGHLPNHFCPSDHLSLIGKFLLTKDTK